MAIIRKTLKSTDTGGQKKTNLVNVVCECPLTLKTLTNKEIESKCHQKLVSNIINLKIPDI